MSSTETRRREVIVTNPEGLNLRGSYAVCALARTFKSRIGIANSTRQVDTRSILDVTCLAAEQGTALTLEAEGEDAEAALDALENLFKENFGQKD